MRFRFQFDGYHYVSIRPYMILCAVGFEKAFKKHPKKSCSLEVRFSKQKERGFTKFNCLAPDGYVDLIHTKTKVFKSLGMEASYLLKKEARKYNLETKSFSVWIKLYED